MSNKISFGHLLFAVAIAVLILTAGCGRPTPEVTPTVTPSPPSSPTPTATLTPSPTATPTPTPTPTPTAPPAAVLGDLRTARLSVPLPQRGAPCGVVDLLDFPIDPPDAERARGGSDFGTFRARYRGNHTGEDWGWGVRSASAGTPVFSIGHGQVMYAQPYGWGTDGGTVVVRHTFSDGSVGYNATILSFYGHLDPPSVSLRAGDCVKRGDPVGQIGRPPFPTHLHFEIRSHMPDMPGPGYWSVDPSLAGWKPPSIYIWNNRVSGLPGVQWLRPFASRSRKGVGFLNQDTFVVMDNAQLAGINVSNGNLRWSLPISETMSAAAIDTASAVVYTGDQQGHVQALGPPYLASASYKPALAPLWEIQLDAAGTPTLIPLPGGGVTLYVQRRLFGISANGDLLWEQDSMDYSINWTFAQDRLILTTSGADASVWTIDRAKPPVRAARIGGRLVASGDQVFVYNSTGVYRLSADMQSANLLYPLPRAYPDLGDAVALPGGGVLVAHMDQADARLIALEADGTLRWQRSYVVAIRVPSATQARPRLAAAGGHVYLVLTNDISSSSITEVFSVDMDGAQLTRIFTGGTRNLAQEDTWAFAVDGDHLLVNYGGGNVTALNARLALKAVQPIDKRE